MNYYKIFKNLFLIFTFFYLTTCPAVHEIGNGYIDHTVINKIENKLDKKKNKENNQLISYCLLKHDLDGICFQSKISERVPLFSSQIFFLKSPFLSTVRLIL